MIGLLLAAATIPPAFHGDWALTASSCAPGPADSGNMRITAKDIRSFESRARVERVEMLGGRTMRVSTRTRHGGGSFGSIEMISVSADGQALTIGEHSDMSIYRRCGR